MKNKLKLSSCLLLTVLFFMPLFVTSIAELGMDDETKQYSIFQIAIMGVFNIPIIAISLGFIIASGICARKGKISLSKRLSIISLVITILGLLFMSTWLFNQS